MRLMVVDDESDMQFLFRQKFRKEIKSGEMQISFALSGQSALQIIEELENRSEYFILTDINMPGMTGIELLKKVKSKYPDQKVIVITAYGDEENYNLAKKYGADDYFTKPLKFNQLKEKLNYINSA